MTTSASPPTPLRILLLDDDPFMLAMLADMLEDLGQLNVRSESTARAALASLPQFRPDLLICDLSLPEMDGIEFLRLAADSRFGGQVILLSGMDAGILQAAQTLAAAQGLSILGACQKPVPAAVLAGLLAQAAAQRP